MNLEQLLQQAKEKRQNLLDSIETAASVEELNKIELDIRKADHKIKDLERQIQERDKNGDGIDPAARSYSPDENPERRGLNPLATFSTSQVQTRDSEDDVFGTLEYRQAFRNYVVNGTPIPEEYKNAEERSDALTVVGDVGAVIPTTIMNKVIEDLTVEGKIINRITQTTFQGGDQMNKKQL